MTDPNKEPSDLDDDDDHPIPYVRRLDVAAKFPGGGASLTIVVASPLTADRKGHERILSKLEAYLGFVKSDEYRSKFGEPSQENTTIVVRIHRGSDPYYFELLEKCRDWVSSSCATLVVEMD